MKNKMIDAIIIGGGASGVMSAVAFKRKNPHGNAVILEKNNRILKKINATGNGRGNYSNTDLSIKHYYGQNPSFADFALLEFGYEKTADFFGSLGIVPAIEEKRVYPMGGQASSITDAFRFEAERLNIPVYTDCAATDVSHKDGVFTVNCETGETFSSRKLVIASGGKAAKKYGTNGDSYRLLEQLGHTVTKVRPALVQITTKKNPFFGMAGIKLDARIDAQGRTFFGELLFTEYGLSGNVIFGATAFLSAYSAYKLSVDFLPPFDLTSLNAHLTKRRGHLGHLNADNFLSGLVNKRLGMLLIKTAGVEKLNIPARNLSDRDLQRIAQALKKTVFDVTGTMGMDNAQATFGGANTGEFNEKTMESRLVPGLYATGEALDILGDCGGYNLQWAWSSGHVCGINL